MTSDQSEQEIDATFGEEAMSPEALKLILRYRAEDRRQGGTDGQHQVRRRADKAKLRIEERELEAG
jgi:hypothetical protein